MSGYGNSHYFSNYLKFANQLNPKLVIIVNISNDLADNFCDGNTGYCSNKNQLCNINSAEELKKNIKFLKIDDQNNFKFIYTKKKII
jgi:hypothetical protein